MQILGFRAIEIAATKFTKSAFADWFLARAGWQLSYSVWRGHAGPSSFFSSRQRPIRVLGLIGGTE
jgi:hypothetical protein